jgi:hypothetical protein
VKEKNESCCVLNVFGEKLVEKMESGFDSDDLLEQDAEQWKVAQLLKSELDSLRQMRQQFVQVLRRAYPR